jgi:hypothetical protein
MMMMMMMISTDDDDDNDDVYDADNACEGRQSPVEKNEVT